MTILLLFLLAIFFGVIAFACGFAVTYIGLSLGKWMVELVIGGRLW